MAVTGGIKQANPSDDYLNGFQTIGGWNVPATIFRRLTGAKLFPTAWTNFTNYNVNRIAPYFWVGAKYAITPQIDVTGAYYYQQQTDYNTSACTYANTTIATYPDGNKLIADSRQQQQMRGHAGRFLRPDRLSARQARRPLRRLDGFQCLRRVRERVPGDPEHRPDRGLRIKF